jgi:hypothetical protein
LICFILFRLRIFAHTLQAELEGAQPPAGVEKPLLEALRWKSQRQIINQTTPNPSKTPFCCAPPAAAFDAKTWPSQSWAASFHFPIMAKRQTKN